MLRVHAPLVVIAICSASLLPCGATRAQKPGVEQQARPLGPEAAHRARRIANAMQAAPSAITDAATIADYPLSEGGALRILRPGTNGWLCLPDDSKTEGNDPVCADSTWMEVNQAIMEKRAPKVSKVGVAYMIAPGGGWGSNTDPYAEAATSSNEWGFDPPHVMLFVTDSAALRGLPTKRTPGMPWVMYPGTPYAHIMVPLSTPGGRRQQ